MSGIVGSKLNIRGSGRIAKLGTDGQVLTSSGAGVAAAFEDLAAGISWQTIVTGSTMNAVAGNGYWIDTTSNACTITLPASASNGDEIMFADYARNWGTNGIIIDSNGLNYQGDDDSYDVEYETNGTALHIVYSGATNGWIPTLDKAVDDAPVTGNDEGIMAFGHRAASPQDCDVTNLISNSGVVASDGSGVGTARSRLSGCEYGGDKAILGFGYYEPTTYLAITNLVSNAGVVASDQAATTGTARRYTAACGYGGDKGIFGFGDDGSNTDATNLVTNAGVVAEDVTGVGTARQQLAACEYGGDKGIFGFGSPTTGVTNLVSNAGVVASDVAAVGTARSASAACGYGYDKGIFYGESGGTNYSNRVSNLGVVASDGQVAGDVRYALSGCEYGQDKGIFFGGDSNPYTGVSNLVTNAGVIGSDVAAVGTARGYLAGCSFN